MKKTTFAETETLLQTAIGLPGRSVKDIAAANIKPGNLHQWKTGGAHLPSAKADRQSLHPHAGNNREGDEYNRVGRGVRRAAMRDVPQRDRKGLDIEDQTMDRHHGAGRAGGGGHDIHFFRPGRGKLQPDQRRVGGQADPLVPPRV